MNNSIIQEAEKVFFKAMRVGYASGAKAKPIPELPGFKGYRYSEGYFRLLDCYTSSAATGFCFGLKFIWHKEGLIWRMIYDGYYPKKTISDRWRHGLEEPLRQ